MARVREVSAFSMRLSSIFRVSGRMSTKTGTAPRNAKAFAVDAKVYDGITISSPGSMRSARAASSSAAVHEWVSRERGAPS